MGARRRSKVWVASLPLLHLLPPVYCLEIRKEKSGSFASAPGSDAKENVPGADGTVWQRQRGPEWQLCIPGAKAPVYLLTGLH